MMAAAAALVLAGCARRMDPTPPTLTANTPDHPAISFIRDPVTGCDYVMVEGNRLGDVAVTPRLRPEGGPFCEPAAETPAEGAR
jgi:hypothetical protein